VSERLDCDVDWVSAQPVEAAIIIDTQRDEIERLRAALERIGMWADAYPLDVFPEPDWRKARALLEAGGMTLDSVSAGAMRRVVGGIGKTAREALRERV
jgi:hypothetical protein